ncbi:MAG: RNA pyrophosphohydrolase [SAR86 cluster bacterium]|nr:RNA pyrophosphohydrolase [SAR86 cluster bacterium]
MTRESGYRLNVGLIVVNHKGKLLLCKRKDSENWQFPQGGIDLGEKPEQAALRELYEEVGIDRSDVQEITSSEGWYKYDLPEASIQKYFFKNKFKGQKQKWFMFKLLNDVSIDFTNDANPEFDDYKWASYWYPLHTIVDFKKDVYRSVLKEFCMPYIEVIS